MNLYFLPLGMSGALLAGAIALLVGAVLLGLVHLFGRRNAWNHAQEIGWAFIATLLASASVDIWNLVHMGIVPMQSTVTVSRILAGIHDPDYLGIRVMCEITGAMLGVMLGWALWTGSLRAHLRGSGNG